VPARISFFDAQRVGKTHLRHGPDAVGTAKAMEEALAGFEGQSLGLAKNGRTHQEAQQNGDSGLDTRHMRLIPQVF